MTNSVKPVPEGFHTATPTLVVRNAAQAIDFYKKVFGAEEIMRMPSPDGKISHAEIKIGDSIIFLSDEFPQQGGKSPQTLGGFTAAFIFTCRTSTTSSRKPSQPAAKPPCRWQICSGGTGTATSSIPLGILGA
jgi:hypothetical protein